MDSPEIPRITVYSLIYTDVLMAHNAGIFGILVLSGEASVEDAQKANPPPDIVLQSIEQLGELMIEVKNKISDEIQLFNATV